MGVGKGDVAPDFTLPGTPEGTEYSLSQYRGQVVVLAFYPGDNTAVCTTQLNQYNGDLDEFTNLGAVLLGISPQDVASHEEFSCKQGFGFPLLADVDKKVGEAYGVLGPVGFYRRSVFVVDGEGIIRYAHRAIAGLTFKSSDELQRAVRSAQSG
jgi:thioredoxin-dependent peroxiredoxin